MGIRLVVEVLDYAPADLTPAERLVLVVIAESANDDTREGWPSLKTIARRAGVKAGSVSKVFFRLSQRVPPIEVRVALGTDRNGRPVFAYEGRKTTYRIPILKQRADQGPTSEEPEGGPPSDLSEPEGGPPSGRGRTTVRERADHRPPLTLTEPSENPQEELRPDVEQVCQHLADKIESNGSKRPNITKTWRTAARHLIDRDSRTVDQITRCIDWCQDDPFWRANILSMPKLREKYDQLRLQAQRTAPAGRPSTTDARVAEALAAGARVQAAFEQKALTT